ncbi:MAG: hypothetical protein ACXVEW_04235, partial [Solirubrobacteraceae bacterium]
VETLIEPMAGVVAMIIATYGSTERDNNAEIVDYDGTPFVMEQAAAADVELVVFISTIYASKKPRLNGALQVRPRGHSNLHGP